MPKDVSAPRTQTPRLRKPDVTDGAAIWELVRACKPLDENSMYCNLVQADHFRDTCVVAELDGEIVGWISGHMIPGQNAFFVWQVAVGEAARGLGLGKQMLAHLINRDECAEAQTLKTTITEDNAASWGLFRSFARDVGGDLIDAPHYHSDDHFGGAHDTEHLVTITLPSEEIVLKSAA
ncbi:diaminobutyrate acetyltransferase [Tropicibacter naphthalenivorans]|uniref:L-2,4-diaminobutyric acid acetyltransferase n=1 Tax=Tropicibacter naphthalenivorans TaxID=441103 RepID=A0A0P1GNB2_9RHOB|nr:diaminobutyrate acetyltransferase [Tropicibacter naphthalenivorans]CUH76124.1 L-2,4-diaminobutyric acid acetyltransferase [Tropicibacter naphthalenivorans]SMC39915.1 diaminobutyrate acetyltransferase [Tropicibacter naphthalenivorans]